MKMNVLKGMAGATIVIAGLVSANADVLVNWQGDYLTTGNRNLNIPTAVVTDNTSFYPYRSTVMLSPNSSGYLASNPSGRFYGSLQFTNAPTQTASQYARVAEASADANNQIQIGSNQGTGAATVNAQGFLAWQKADFINDSSSTISLSSIGQFTTTISSLQGTSRDVRFLVQNGSTWYLSETFTSTTGQFSMTDLASSMWCEWELSATGMIAAPTSFTTAASSLTDVTSVGLYFNLTNNSSARAQIYIDAFSVTTAIPEPNAVALAGFGLGVVILGSRFRGLASRGK